MGVSELWSLLKSVGVTKFWSGGEGTHAIIVTEVEGKSIAIDLSAWIVQATCQPNLVEVFSDPGSQALIVTFNRVRHCLSRTAGIDYAADGQVRLVFSEKRALLRFRVSDCLFWPGCELHQIWLCACWAH